MNDIEFRFLLWFDNSAGQITIGDESKRWWMGQSKIEMKGLAWVCIGTYGMIEANAVYPSKTRNK